MQELNFFLPFNLFNLLQITLFLFLSYGLIVFLLTIVIFFLVQFFRGQKINLAWFSPSFLILGFTLGLLILLVIFKINFSFFRSFYTPENFNRINQQQLVFFIIIFTGLSCFYFLIKTNKKILPLSVYFSLLVIANLIIFSQRPSLNLVENKGPNYFEIKTPEKMVTIIGLEGLSFDFLIPLADDQKLPNFSWLFEEGSWGQLHSFTPNDPFILNKSIFTGKLPANHYHFSRYKYYLPNLKWPLQVVPRFIFFRQLTRFGLLTLSPLPLSSYGNDLWEIIRLNQGKALRKDWPYNYQTFLPEEALKSFHRIFPEFQSEDAFLISILKEAFLEDYEFEKTFYSEKNHLSPHLSSLFLDGLNEVEAYFYKFYFPDYFGEISQDDIHRYRPVIEKYYQFYDQIIGKYLATLKDNELLVIYSPHGVEPLSLWKRVVEWLFGNSNISADHDLGPDGVVFFFGKEVARGKNIGYISLTDLAPTILYYLGLPVARDMDGIVRSTVFTPSFTAENPIFYITTYEK